MQVSKTSLDIVKLAARNKLNLINLPLKDKSTAKILWNNNEVDCFIMKNDKIIGGRGMRGGFDSTQKELAFLYDQFQHKVADGVDITKKFVNSFRKVK